MLGQIPLNDITHSENGFSPTGDIEQMLLRHICKYVFESDGAIFSHDEVLVGCLLSVCQCMAFGVREVLQTEVLGPAIFHQLDNPQRVDELVWIKLPRAPWNEGGLGHFVTMWFRVAI